MPKLRIVSSQNVPIDYELATVMERIAGGVIDSVFQIIYLTITFSVISNNIPFMGWTIILYFLPVMLYSLVFETLFNGRTPAKMMLGLRVISIDGKRAGFTSFFIRWVFRIIDVVMTAGGVAITSVFFSSKAQRVGDVVARTSVVRTNSRPAAYNPLLISVPAEYKVVYPQVKMLSEKDVLTISRVLSYYFRMNTSVSAIRLMQKMRTRVSEVLGVTPEGKSDVFFQTILKDYSALNRQQQNTGVFSPSGFQNPIPNNINI
ncbi:hypothetical protein SDC9_56636 [bioreactor metagenome]|uniref:RDD domain-containing protein n=1 Tax=bioreactor metagenome TaxID=1076179 RepID=A0A644X2W8_9ZZZZ